MAIPFGDVGHAFKLPVALLDLRPPGNPQCSAWRQFASASSTPYPVCRVSVPGRVLINPEQFEEIENADRPFELR